MSQTAIEIVIKAVDQASAQIKGISRSLENMQPTFQKMALAGTAAFGAISAIGIKSVKDFADAEASAAMLEHAVIGVTHATKDQLDATSKLADELERKGVLDGDNIKRGLAQLSTFGLSNDAVRGLGKSLADLAVNQYGVSASGEQLSDTANMIAKALNGQFGVLEKSGIRFTEAQQNIIKYGTEMQKVDAINQGFAQNLKFTNEVALGTTDGQMAKAAVTAGNLSEAIGGVLTPMVNKLAEVLVPVLQRTTEWINAHPELTKYIVLATAGIAALVAIIGTLGLIIPTIVAGFGALSAAGGVLAGVVLGITWPIALVIAGITALIAAGYLLWKHWDAIKAKAIEIWNSIKDFFTEHWQLILSILTMGLSNIVITLIDNFEPITSAWNNIWDAVKGHLVSIMEGAKGVIMGTINWVIDKLNGAINLANQAISLANKVPGVNIGAISNIPKLAGGGIVTSPTLALIGEAGPEAVVPLDRADRVGGGGINVTLNIGNFFGGNPDVAARELGDLIIKRLQLNARVS